jgi:hypothetical protein
MSKHQTPLTTVNGWLVDIATKVAVATGDKERMRAVKQSAALFASKLPPEAFTDEARDWLLAKPGIEVVAPSTMVEWLIGWWDERRPRKPGELPKDIEESGLDKTDQRWAAFFRLRREQGAHTPALRVVLSLVRREAPTAFDWLLKHDIDAAAVSRVAGFGAITDRERRLRLEWANEAAVRRAIATCFGSHDDGRTTQPNEANINAALKMLRAIVEQWAPENLHLIPASARAGRVADAPVEEGEPVFG